MELYSPNYDKPGYSPAYLLFTHTTLIDTSRQSESL